MRRIQLCDAKASLSPIVDEVSKGETAIITRHGKRTAVLIDYREWQRLIDVPSFARLLTSAPLEAGDLPERDQTPVRDFPV
jgi:prevent-host-death family protein